MDAVERYWIHDTVADVGMPYGENTVGIVDEMQGGVILYVHEGNAQSVLAALRDAHTERTQDWEDDAKTYETYERVTVTVQGMMGEMIADHTDFELTGEQAGAMFRGIASVG